MTEMQRCPHQHHGSALPHRHQEALRAIVAARGGRKSLARETRTSKTTIDKAIGGQRLTHAASLRLRLWLEKRDAVP